MILIILLYIAKKCQGHLVIELVSSDSKLEIPFRSCSRLTTILPESSCGLRNSFLRKWHRAGSLMMSVEALKCSGVCSFRERFFHVGSTLTLHNVSNIGPQCPLTNTSKYIDFMLPGALCNFFFERR